MIIPVVVIAIAMTLIGAAVWIGTRISNERAQRAYNEYVAVRRRRASMMKRLLPNKKT